MHVKPTTQRALSGASPGPLIHLLDLRALLVVMLALCAGALAYQAPPSTDIAVGWAGDQLFLPSSEGQSERETQGNYWHSDEPTDTAPSGRSRWTRQTSVIELPGLGESRSLTLNLRAQGWPDDVLNTRTTQPTVTVLANGQEIGQFQPTSDWTEHQFALPAISGDKLTILLQSSDVFTGTTRYVNDPRPKGIRVDHIGLRGRDTLQPTVPNIPALLQLALNAGLCFLALQLLFQRRTPAFVTSTLLIGAFTMGLALARIWAVALLPWVTSALGLALLAIRRRDVIGLLDRAVRRYTQGEALNYGLITAGATWLVYVVARATEGVQLPGLDDVRANFADSLLLGLLGMGLLVLILVRGRDGLPKICRGLTDVLREKQSARTVIVSFAVIWIGYLASVALPLPYVGHADYADNAVVARNLVAERGWVVDYVTQFYQLYDGVTRPQETWPLLQPVWIAPFFMFFGATDWAAKIPNLIFMTILCGLIYIVGARLWDRRVGITAAIIILTSHIFFRMVIYTTSDLAFAVFSFGAIYLVYTWSRSVGKGTRSCFRRHLFDTHAALWAARAGLLTGLMLLQKPSGGLIAFGMGLWLLAWTWHEHRKRALTVRQLELRTRLLHPRAAAKRRYDSATRFIRNYVKPLLVWGVIALLVLSPYLLRNLYTFGKPFYSTESRDAWVLGYTQWDEIYKVYTDEAGLGNGDLPDHTWILRWGFDRTLNKIWNQVLESRYFLLPPLSGISGPPLLVGREDKPAMLYEMGAWLALFGFFGALRPKRRLISLLLAAFTPYLLFLMLYWRTDEVRYFVMVMPWLALFAAYALWRAYDRIAAIGNGRWAPVGLAMVVAALALIIQPSWPEIAEKVHNEPALYTPDLDVYGWLEQNTAPDAVMMTRNPWQLNWHSERPALMIPYTTDREVLLRLARYYNVRYLVLDSLSRPDRPIQRMIENMVQDPQLGFQRVYTSPRYTAVIGGRPIETITHVYRFPDDYGGVVGLGP